jgi:hypothetical protein
MATGYETRADGPAGTAIWPAAVAFIAAKSLTVTVIPF